VQAMLRQPRLQGLDAQPVAVIGIALRLSGRKLGTWEEIGISNFTSQFHQPLKSLN